MNTGDFLISALFCPFRPVCPVCPVCPVEPISAFYGQDGQEAVAVLTAAKALLIALAGGPLTSTLAGDWSMTGMQPPQT
jgi:hypothetical protein